MKKTLLLIFMLTTIIYSEEIYSENRYGNSANIRSGFYMETSVDFTDNKDKIIGKTQSAKELTGKRRNINELDFGLYTYDNTRGAKVYGSLWFGNADQYGVGFGIEGKYKLFTSIPVAFILGFDEKLGIGYDVFEEKNITIWALNGGAPTKVYFTDNTRFDTTALKFGFEFDVSKHFAINIAYMPRWDRYKIKYRQTETPFFWKEHEASWHEFHSSVKVGIAVYF
ncbi:MAG: hypothetical protein LBS39_00575 [Campylobacteraceae bacterium]|nr:hypothetical protein [Campylobacteraceae bacterium]